MKQSYAYALDKEKTPYKKLGGWTYASVVVNGLRGGVLAGG